jgi:hypothetical protein
MQSTSHENTATDQPKPTTGEWTVHQWKDGAGNLTSSYEIHEGDKLIVADLEKSECDDIANAHNAVVFQLSDKIGQLSLSGNDCNVGAAGQESNVTGITAPSTQPKPNLTAKQLATKAAADIADSEGYPDSINIIEDAINAALRAQLSEQEQSSWDEIAKLENKLAAAQAANVSYYDFIRSYFVDGILRHTNGKSYRELAKELLANEPDTSALAAAVAEAQKPLDALHQIGLLAGSGDNGDPPQVKLEAIAKRCQKEIALAKVGK